MTTHDQTRDPFRADHIDAWRSSKLSQNACCREPHLRPNRLGYWKRKRTTPDTDQNPKTPAPAPAFVPLAVDNRHVSQGLCLRLPNGCELFGIEAQHLPLVTRLVEGLI